MIETLQELTEQYTAALEDYLAGGKEETLQRAYELGRKAIAEGVGVLEMAAIHNKSLAAVFTNPLTHREALRVAGHASTFFAESLSPFEMVLRGYREANARLRANLQQIEAAEQELQRQNRELAAAHRLVEAERERYQELFNFAPDAYFVTDLEGIIQEVNSPAANLLKIQKDALAGTPLLRFVSEMEQESLCDLLGKLRNGEVERVEDWQVTLQMQGGGAVPVSVRIRVVREARGNRLGLRWLMSDITERKQIEEERAQLRIREHIAHAEMEAARQLKFLADASATLAASLDYEAIIGRMARLAVPYLADCCFVHLVEDSVSVRHLAVTHSDPAKAGQASRLQQCCSTQTKIPELLAAILQSTRAEMIPEVSDAWLERFAANREILGILREWNLKSALLVPLWANERFLGAITFARSEGSLPYTREDVTLAEVFARRCSLVLDNARLHFQVVAERDRAEKASLAKDEFVAILSHELRTPLTIILGWARVLKKQTAIQKDPMLNEGVQALEHNAQNIARLVEDCLDITRIAERKIQLQKELVDLNQVVKAALEAMREAVCNKDLNYLIHLCPTNLRVLGDRTRLEQVVLNLLTNAVKYTEKGGMISVSSVQIGQEAEILVQDTGIGIAPEFLEQVFDSFHQGTLRWFASDSGLGLGLTIARGIVQMHGGRIWAESDGPGRGSTFRLRLPLATAEPSTAHREDAAAVPVPDKAKPLRILFIEDSADVLNLMRIELEDAGFSVLTATDAKTGLEVAQRERPDIIVSDIKMPGLDGYEFIRQLRQIPELASVPAIALTGFGMKQDVDKALTAGYNAHLCKPVEVEQLIALVKNLTSL